MMKQTLRHLALFFLFGFIWQVIFSESFAQTAQTVFVREALRSQENVYTGRFEVSAKEASKVYELYRFTYSQSDKNRERPMSIAFLYLGKPSDAYNSLKAAEIKFQYGANGLLLEKDILNAAGKPTEIRRYDYVGRKVATESIYDGKKTLTEQITYNYDENGNLLERAFKNAKGKLADNRLGYAIRKYAYDDKNRVITEEVFTEKRSSLLKIEFAYDRDGQLRQKTVRDELGHIKELIVFDYNEAGLVSEKKTLNPFKYVKQQTLYKYDSDKRLIEERTLDANGLLLGDMFDVAVVQTQYRSDGVRKEEVRLDSKSRFKNKVIYNEFEQVLERIEYTAQGLPGLIIRREYDDYGNLRGERNYKIKSASRREILNEELVYEKARLREHRYYDAAGRLNAKEVLNADGQAIEEIYYDANGKITRRKTR
ncbi:hypothetical protein Ctha_0908 [Chloroherpeton thalassium ATCC 35110]|uniref:YD repeat protein n=1 Tax=Chloroherpeton thalassium (strain ATCC 35110 / GB-78) TaxID=517418 RepID=B3QX99_CHLT3|nr:hypothetical protein [Chloroherpeton thalassium]ACF13373.1 hypothetical protein Ctha_0908 [Chloroherpeton thalassium ATCC 35110]